MPCRAEAAAPGGLRAWEPRAAHQPAGPGLALRALTSHLQPATSTDKFGALIYGLVSRPLACPDWPGSPALRPSWASRALPGLALPGHAMPSRDSMGEWMGGGRPRDEGGPREGSAPPRPALPVVMDFELAADGLAQVHRGDRAGTGTRSASATPAQGPPSESLNSLPRDVVGCTTRVDAMADAMADALRSQLAPPRPASLQCQLGLMRGTVGGVTLPVQPARTPCLQPPAALPNPDPGWPGLGLSLQSAPRGNRLGVQSLAFTCSF